MVDGPVVVVDAGRVVVVADDLDVLVVEDASSSSPPLHPPAMIAAHASNSANPLERRR